MPAECTTAAFALYPVGLSPLPGTAESWARLDPDTRARVQLAIKSADTQRYQLLRAQALRCAR